MCDETGVGGTLGPAAFFFSFRGFQLTTAKFWYGLGWNDYLIT